MNAFMKFAEITIKECKLSELAKENPGRTLDYKELDKSINSLIKGLIVDENGDKYKTDDNGNPYQKYNSETVKWELMPNTKYEINGYEYETDEYGHIILAEGKLTPTERESRKTITTDVEDKKDTDDKGHLIGDRFDGDNDIGNLLPMDANLNRGEFKKLENELAKAVAEGKEVYIKIEPQYEGDSKRPVSFKVTYTIDGETFEKVFENKPKEN